MARSNANVNVLIGANLKAFSTAMQNAERDIKRVGKSFKKVGKNLSLSVSLPLAAVGGSALKAAAELETLETSLSVLTGSTIEGKKALKDLSDFTAKTPFQLEQVGKAAKQLLAFGFTTDQVKSNLQILGDVAAGSGNQISEVAQIFGQVSAAGKLTGERFNQLQERAIPIGPAIAKTMGIAESELRDFIKEGAVGFEEFETAFKSLATQGGLFAGAMQKQSETMSGLFSTLKDNVNLAFGELGVAIAETVNLKDLVAQLTENIQGLVKWFKGLDEGTKKIIITLGGLTAIVGPLLTGMGFLMTNVVPGLVKGFGLLTGVASKVAVAIKGINTAMLATGAAASGIAAVVASIVYGFTVMVQKITPAVSKLETFFNLVKSGGNYQRFVALQMQDQIQAVSDEAAARAEANKVLEDTNALLQQYSTHLSTIQSQTSNSKTRPKAEAITGPTKGLYNYEDDLVNAGIGGVDLFTGSLKTQDEIQGQVDAIDSLIQKQQELAETADIVGSTVAHSFADMSNNFIDSLGLADDGFEGFVKSLAKNVTQIIATLLAQSIANAISGGAAAGASTGPGAVAAIPAFIASLTAAVLGAFASIPKFATGGVVGGSSFYGDKLLARVNSGEAILNVDQQRRLYGMIGSNGVNVNLEGEFRLDGRDLVLSAKRASDFNLRLGT